jgi:hypothetical protein
LTINAGDAQTVGKRLWLRIPGLGRLQRVDLGILPLLLSFPFRRRQFVLREDIPLVIVAVVYIIIYAIRCVSDLDLLRAGYMQAAFIALWLVCRREHGDLFPAAVRMTVIVWFAVGLYQYVCVALGIPIEMTGRFVEGRSGVPSLASEASTYGSLSMVQLMYLLSENNAKNRPYIICAAASVLLSGSLLALGLFVFPLMKLKPRYRIMVIIAVPVLALADYSLTAAGLTSRLSNVGSGDSLVDLILDPSLNLRLGQIYFTLYENLRASLLFASPVDFMAQYNDFANKTPFLLETGVNYILTSAGDLIYGGGPVGALLIFMFIRKAQAQAATRAKKFEKVAFIAACMLNPIPLSNVFLVIYAQRKT